MASKSLNLDDILKKNPQVDHKDLERSKALTEELSKLGIQPRGYRLAPAFERRRATVCDEKDDPRLVKLSVSRRG